MMEKTIPVPSRVNVCSFATLARAYEAEGIRLRSKSDILWQAVEQLATLYSRKQGIEPFTDIYEAVEYMERIGLPLATNKTVDRAIRTAAQMQNLEGDFGVSSTGYSTKKGLQKEEREGDRKLYDIVANSIRKGGGTPMSYEQYMENKKRVVEQQAEEAIVETVNEAEFAAKEEQKREALRSGLSAIPADITMVND
jgi:Mg-chelatase subunit ChlI